MSADNGIYILPSPVARSGLTEYRVAHGQAIENIDYFGQERPECKAYEAIYFGTAPVFYTEREAVEYATFMEGKHYASGYPTEYGVCLLEKRKFPFVRMGQATARRILGWDKS